MMDDSVLPTDAPSNAQRHWLWLLLALGCTSCLVLAIVGHFLVDAPGLVTGALIGLISIVPFAAVALVQLGERHAGARAASVYGWCMCAFAGWCLTILATMAPYQEAGGLKAGAGSRVLIAFALAGAATAAGFGCLLPAGRRLASRWLPINPQSFISAMSLAVAIPMTCSCLIPLAVTGRVPMSMSEEKMADAAKTGDMMLPLLVFQLVWLVLFSTVAGGFPIRRDFPGTLRRLGVGRIGPVDALVAIAVAIGLVVCIIPTELGMQKLWTYLGWPTTDEKSVEQWFSGIKSWYGAIIVGVVAGISEELLVRGLLQPRLGLILSNLLFMAGHAFHYHWDGLLIVFLIGLVCGLVRRRYNTTTSMIVHGLYDTILVFLATYAGEYLK